MPMTFGQRLHQQLGSGTLEFGARICHAYLTLPGSSVNVFSQIRPCWFLIDNFFHFQALKVSRSVLGSLLNVDRHCIIFESLVRPIWQDPFGETRGESLHCARTARYF